MEEKEHKYKWYTFGCKDAGYLHEKKLHQGLTAGEKILYYFHLSICHLCRRYVRHLNLIHNNLMEWMKGIGMDPGKKEELKKKMAGS